MCTRCGRATLTSAGGAPPPDDRPAQREQRHRARPGDALELAAAVHIASQNSVAVRLCLSLCPSVPLSLCPFVPLSLCPSVTLSLCPSVPMSLRPSVPPTVGPSDCMHACRSVYLDLGTSLNPSDPTELPRRLDLYPTGCAVLLEQNGNINDINRVSTRHTVHMLRGACRHLTCACMSACMRSCMRACMHARLPTYLSARVCVCVCVCV